MIGLLYQLLLLILVKVDHSDLCLSTAGIGEHRLIVAEAPVSRARPGVRARGLLFPI